ncbi:MAG: hypothetical protein JWM20_308 [Patescibacteria group bacterium]|nr:hypothetical protein [Patescibacteria group bacterium]
MKYKIDLEDEWAILKLADKAGATSRLTRSPMAKLSGAFQVNPAEVSEEFILQKLLKKNRIKSQQNTKDCLIRNEEVKQEKQRARRRAFYFK